jgi:hypothetical protein
MRRKMEEELRRRQDDYIMREELERFKISCYNSDTYQIEAAKGGRRRIVPGSSIPKHNADIPYGEGRVLEASSTNRPSGGKPYFVVFLIV